MHEHRTMNRWHEFALLVASGVMLVLAFPPIDFVPAAFVALVPLFWVLTKTRRQGFWSGFRPGFRAGMAFFGPLLYWLIFLSSDQMDNPLVMSGPFVLLVFLQSLYWGLFSASATLVGARTNVPAYVYIPILWVAFEQLRSLGVLGFTWGAVGYAAVTVPVAIQFAAVTGLFGVSLWIILVNARVMGLLTARRKGPYALATVLAAAVPFIHGTAVMEDFSDRESVRVAVIQPNIPPEVKWDARYKSVSFDALEALSREAGREKPDLIVWPETAAPTYLLREPDDLSRVGAIAREVGAPILTGCPHFEPGEGGTSYRTLNSAVLITLDGLPDGRYDKMRLVPFGEVIPFETVVPILRRVDFGEADFSPGREHVVFPHPVAPFSALICFESAFPRLARQFVAGGSRLLVNITNDVWYGRTSMPFQHASMAIMRSIETRRSLARSANSGVSMLVDPRGRVLARTGIFERGVLIADLPVVTGMTFYAARGDVLPWMACGLGGLMVLSGAVRRKDR